MTAIASAVALMGVSAPAALAQSSSEKGYDGEAPVGQVEGIAPQQEVGAGNTGPVGDTVTGQVVSESAVGDGGTLPFTGWDLGIVLMLGLALAGTGIVVRRAARSTGS